jgi:hypothetical protein
MSPKAPSLFLFALCSVLLCSCDADPSFPPPPYTYGNTPDLILKDFQTAWKLRDVERYAELLSDDFRFYFDPDTRADKGLPEFWDRGTDSTQVGKLFSSTEVNDIRIMMMYSPTPITDPAKPDWELINVGDEFLEVELRPQPGQVEGITIVVDGEIQKFYFRKGRTEADTLASSTTSSKYYIVEWHDMGVQLAVSDHLMSMPATWGMVKNLFR